MTKAYFLRGDSYVRYDLDANRADQGYPKLITQGWSGIAGTGFDSGIDTAVDLGTGKLYLFRGDAYLRVDHQSNSVDGAVTAIADAWGGLADAGFADSLDAAVNWGNGNVYFFRGDAYLRYDIAADAAPDGPRSIAENWPGLAEMGFAQDIDAAVNWGDGKVYFFKDTQYVRYDMAADRADEGYPLPIAGNWPGLDEAGFGGSIDAAWVKLGVGTTPPPQPVGALQPGDHVWYYDGKVSTSKEIPRSAWFPGSTSPTDYQGHGKEIYHFVIHANGQIFRGRPHMRNHEGSFAWLNNNPGNITGKPGGPDYGQYRDKFNWHNFLVFPTREAGFRAIGLLLRGPTYRDLTITQAMERYAPAKDGNDPVAYAQSVASSAGVPTTTLVRDLNDDQLRIMQEKIEQVEGSVPGAVLTRDSPELPEAVRSLLP